MKIDITSIVEDNPYKTIVYKEYKHINIVLNYKTTKGIIYVCHQIYMNFEPKYKLLQQIEVEYQKTGFGYKKFFKCPCCSKRRKYLYFTDIDKFACRECIDRNVYSYRTNLYDGNIENVIKYKIVMLLHDLKADIKKINMLNLISNIPNKPKYMRWSKYELKVEQMYFLEFIYWELVNKRMERFKVKELNDMLCGDNVKFVYGHIIFPKYYKDINIVG